MFHTSILNYQEDSTSEVDMNVVMTGSGALVEIQGTAERQPFAEARLVQMLALARQGIKQLIAAQRHTLGYQHRLRSCDRSTRQR